MEPGEHAQGGLGIDAASVAAVQGFYDTICETTVAVSGTRGARAHQVAGEHLPARQHRPGQRAGHVRRGSGHRRLGIDVWESIDAASTKPFGYLRFTPGPGVGGHCLPIDPSYLSWRVRRALGQPFRFVELANDINDHMPDYVVRRLVVALNRKRQAVNGSRILLLGLAYKANTGDDRESPAVVVAERLLADPHVSHDHVQGHVERVDVTSEELAAADAVILLTDHAEFDLAAARTHARYVLDARHRLEPGDTVEFL